jgi:hypothetical protein
MDPLGFGRIIAEKWDVLMMSPAAFAAVLGFGFVLGLAITRIFLNERLTHQQIRIADLQAVLDEKLPAHFLPLPKQRKLMSFPMILAGLVLASIGLVVTAVGIFWQWEPSKRGQTSKPQMTEVSPTKANALLPDDGGPITWNSGYLLGAGGDDKGIRISTLQMTGQNNSDEFIEPLSGVIRSEVTGVQLPILVNDNGTLVPPDGYGIPARHQFMIGCKLSETGISGVEFLRDFGRMTFTFIYGNHTYTKRFTPEELEAELRRTENDLRPKELSPIFGDGLAGQAAAVIG